MQTESDLHLTGITILNLRLDAIEGSKLATQQAAGAT